MNGADRQVHSEAALPSDVQQDAADRAAPTRQRRRVAWLLFGVLSVVYLLTGKGFSEILDAEGYYLITKALVEDGQVGIKTELSSAVLRGDEPTRDGRAFLHFGIGYPLVMVPFYVAGKTVGQVAIVAVPRLAKFERFFTRAATSTGLAFLTAGTAVALYYLLLQFGMTVTAAAAGGLIFGLATYAWPYSKIGFYEPFLGLCQTLCLLWALQYSLTRRPGWLVLAGFATGWGIAAKPSLILLLPVLGVYVAWAALRGEGRGRWARFGVATAAVLAGLMTWVLVIGWYNAQRSGATTNMGYSEGNYRPVLDARHIASALYGNTFSTGRGFFLYSPACILFVLGLSWMWRNRRAELVAIVALILLNFGFFATRANWATIRPWGPRYVEPLAPLFIAIAIPGIAALWSRAAPRRLIWGVLGAGVLVQLLAISMPFGSWLDMVKQETGSGFSAVFEHKYSPLWGQIVLLSDAELRPLDLESSNVGSGEPTEVFKRELRRTPDFWFAYCYRLGLPPVVIIGGLLVLLAAGGWLAALLRNELGPERAGAPAPLQE